MTKTVRPWAYLIFRAVISSLALLPPPSLGCTTIAVGKDATTDGSVLSSHSNDGEGSTDPRLVLIPASDWPTLSLRPVFYSPEFFPRYVGSSRATIPVEAYIPGHGDEPFSPICHIPQVSHTYRYMEQTYGAMNERQLGISESTCSGVFGAAPKGISYPEYGVGKACLSVDALSQIAMERHGRARSAIEEMGALAEEYGFYGAGLFEGTAESLMVTDTEEAWVFHILPDPEGESAIWAARRVPDDMFAVVPNVFVIREIDTEDDENFMFSDSVFEVAADLGWWDPEGGSKLDFTAVYSDGEYSHKFYSGRRSWGVYNMFAPSLRLQPDYVEWRISNPYPFAAKPDKNLSVSDVADAMRSYYQGTQYSQAADSPSWAGGPWKTPDHVAGGNNTPLSQPQGGNWERTVGLYRTSDSYITQSRSWLPDASGGVLWFAPYAAPYSVYVPFAVGMEELPHATLGAHMRLDKTTLFWAFRFLGNYVQLKWNAMMEEVVKYQATAMRQNLELQAHVDALIRSGGDARPALNLYSTNAELILNRTWDLCDHLMFKFADGQVHSTASPYGTSTPPRSYGASGETIEEAEVVDQPGYPAEWLETVGFLDGPPPPPDCAELEWRCGHRPEGSLQDSDDRVVSAWMGYVHRKSVAKASGKSSCNAVGDVAAAVNKCSNERGVGDVPAASDTVRG